SCGRPKLKTRSSFEEAIEELSQPVQIARAIGFDGAIVAAVNLPKHLRLVRRHEVALCMTEPNEIVAPAVHDQDRDVNARKLFHGFVANSSHKPDREERIEIGADVGNAAKSILQNQTADFFAQRDFGGNTAAERLAEQDDILRP